MSEEIRCVELFSGIRGFGLGLDRASPRYKTVWANDVNKYRAQVYRQHNPEIPYHLGDISAVKAEDIPPHDILSGGFPCQPFSSAGKRKGFSDFRGTLFFEICRIAEYHRPRIIFLENVKGLLSAKAVDEAGNSIRGTKGYVFWRILNALEELGYWVEWQVLNSKDFGVPQNRERVFIIGHLRDGCSREIFPIKESGTVPVRRDAKRSVASTLQSPGHASGNYRGMTMISESALIHSRGLETRKDGISHAIKGGGGGSSKNFVVQTGITQTNPHDQSNPGEVKFVDHSRTIKSPTGHQDTLVLRFPLKFIERNQKNIEGDYSFTVDTVNTGGLIVADRSRHLNKKGRNLESPKPYSNAISSVPKDNLVLKGTRIRRKMPIEDERLQGFPDNWTSELSDTQRYKALGDAVTVNVIEFLGKRLLRCFDD